MGPVYIFLNLNTALAQTSLKIAFLDTGFCTEKIKPVSKQVKVNSVVDLTHSVKLDCLNLSFNKNFPRFHGQLVLEEFLAFFVPAKVSVNIYPLIIFDHKGEQKKEYWLKAIDWIKKNKIDVVVTAAGLVTEDKLVKELPAVWFVPSGRVTPQIKKENSLFPQNLAPLKNLFLIGDFYDGKNVIYDQELLFQDQIDYFFPSGQNNFVGTSRAVAEASARALSLCPLATLRDCLKSKSKQYTDNLSSKNITTF
ncbi:MAG: hypothetical protein Q7U04_13025 [Bacteriovorax sp.]|nr:hypothetical protein [Bacteriovorax sp.]